MPWSSKLIILTEGQRLSADGYRDEEARPRGSILDVIPGNQEKTFGAAVTNMGVLTVNGIPDTITRGEWRRLLLREWREGVRPPAPEKDRRPLKKWRDVRVVYSELTPAQKNGLEGPNKAANIGYNTFLQKARIERKARRLEENDLTMPEPD